MVEGSQRRDLADVLWQIGERRGCNEIVVRYDCGHTLRAEVSAPVLPKIQEYGSGEAERRRYLQHCLHVLTRDPSATQVQITVQEGRCRHCSRGSRQTLVCGPIHADLRESAVPANAAKVSQNSLDSLQHMAGKKLELPMTSHAFLAAMGAVCQLPDSANGSSSLLLTQNNQAVLQNPFDAPALSREGIKQCLRKDIEEEMESEFRRYFYCAGLVLVLLAAECVYLFLVHLRPSQDLLESDWDELAAGNTTVKGARLGLSNLTSLSSLELRIANSTWVLSALTLAVHKAFGPSEFVEESKDVAGSNVNFMWGAVWNVVHPLWVVTSVMLAPLLWVLDLVVAVPRFMILNVLFAGVREIIWRPCGFLLSVLARGVFNLVAFLLRCIFSPPTAVAYMPTANPMAAAMMLCIVIAIITSPVPLTFLLHNLWTDFASLDLIRKLKRTVLGAQVLDRLGWASARNNEARSKGGGGGVGRSMPTSKASAKDSRGSSGAAADKGSGSQGLRSEGSVGSKEKLQGSGGGILFAPPCFVCLDRPSRYALEPCGHRVVCGECAVQLVDPRSRTANEVAGHQTDRGGGQCPSCGQAITRAMRIFS